MKKLTAMLLSLVMCFSLMAIPAQAACTPDPDIPSIGDLGENPTEPGDDDPDEPDDPEEPDDPDDPLRTLPYPRENMPTRG